MLRDSKKSLFYNNENLKGITIEKLNSKTSGSITVMRIWSMSMFNCHENNVKIQTFLIIGFIFFWYNNLFDFILE